MGLNISQRRVNLEVVDYPLPGVLDAKGDTATISIEAHATGGVNPEYGAAASELISYARAKEIGIEKIECDEEKFRAKSALIKDVIFRRQENFFDHCVVNWSTTIFDKGAKGPLSATRENFLSLLDMNIPSVAKFFAHVEDLASEKGKELAEADEELAKNWNGRS